MKYLAILTLAVAALGLGACAKSHDSGYNATTTHSASTGYTK